MASRKGGALLITQTVGDKAVRRCLTLGLAKRGAEDLIRAGENLKAIIELAAQPLYETRDRRSFDGTIMVSSAELHGG